MGKRKLKVCIIRIFTTRREEEVHGGNGTEPTAGQPAPNNMDRSTWTRSGEVKFKTRFSWPGDFEGVFKGTVSRDSVSTETTDA
jgi:hypothetical protein